MFTHTTFVKKATHHAHGHKWEIELYRVIEDGSYKIFVFSNHGNKGDALFMTDSETGQPQDEYEAELIEKAKADIDSNEDNKYDL